MKKKYILVQLTSKLNSLFEVGTNSIQFEIRNEFALDTEEEALLALELSPRGLYSIITVYVKD